MTNPLSSFSIPNFINFQEGPGGLIVARLQRDSKNLLEVSLYGAHALRWLADDREMLFLSKKSTFEVGKAIRGGIPLVFPQFGLGDMPAHGFARILPWEVLHTEKDESKDLTLCLGLESSAETKQYWEADFKAEVRFILGDSLRQEFSVENLGATTLEFQHAFHTYHAIDSLEDIRASSFVGMNFLDSTQNRKPGLEDRDVVTFTEEIDRIYQGAPAEVKISQYPGQALVSVKQEGMKDFVLWNPGQTRCAAIPDLEDGDYKKYICIEPGNVVQKVRVHAGDRWSCSQTLSLLSN